MNFLSKCLISLSLVVSSFAVMAQGDKCYLTMKKELWLDGQPNDWMVIGVVRDMKGAPKPGGRTTADTIDKTADFKLEYECGSKMNGEYYLQVTVSDLGPKAIKGISTSKSTGVFPKSTQYLRHCLNKMKGGNDYTFHPRYDNSRFRSGPPEFCDYFG